MPTRQLAEPEPHSIVATDAVAPATDRSLARNAWMAAALVVLLIIAARSIFLAIEHGLFAPWGGGDFHAYWYYGHFVRRGVSPYHAFFTDPTAIAGPVRYLDGVTVQHLTPQLSMMPANTAPMLLLLSVFSWLSWPLAKALWLGCNLLVAAAVPWLAIR